MSCGQVFFIARVVVLNSTYKSHCCRYRLSHQFKLFGSNRRVGSVAIEQGSCSKKSVLRPNAVDEITMVQFEDRNHSNLTYPIPDSLILTMSLCCYNCVKIRIVSVVKPSHVISVKPSHVISRIKHS